MQVHIIHATGASKIAVNGTPEVPSGSPGCYTPRSGGHTVDSRFIFGMFSTFIVQQMAVQRQAPSIVHDAQHMSGDASWTRRLASAFRRITPCTSDTRNFAEFCGAHG